MSFSDWDSCQVSGFLRLRLLFYAKLSSYFVFYAVESLRQNPKKKENRRANMSMGSPEY